MAWIDVIDEDEATGRLKELYEKYWDDSFGGVDNILKIHSLNVKSMQVHYELYAHLMHGRSDLSRAQREMIAVVVSAANRCYYWIEHHGEGLRRLTGDDGLVARLKVDWREAEIDEADRAMLGYVEKLTLRPWDMVEKDVIALREAGFSDGAILDMNQVAGYYAYVNRLADGLGVELEAFWSE
jgi:uncharacterized peroxidase-related enzyme